MNGEDSYQVFDKIRHILICSAFALTLAVTVICNIHTATSQALQLIISQFQETKLERFKEKCRSSS